MMTDIVQQLRDACVGHPNAAIPWPHRLLHEAADEIERLRMEIEMLRLLDAEDPMLDIRKAVASTLRRMPLSVNSDKEFTDCVIDLLPDYFREGVLRRLTKSGGQGELFSEKFNQGDERANA